GLGVFFLPGRGMRELSLSCSENRTSLQRAVRQPLLPEPFLCHTTETVGIAGVEALLASRCAILNAAERRYSSDNARFPRFALRLGGRSLIRTGKGVLQWSRILRT